MSEFTGMVLPITRRITLGEIARHDQSAVEIKSVGSTPVAGEHDGFTFTDHEHRMQTSRAIELDTRLGAAEPLPMPGHDRYVQVGHMVQIRFVNYKYEDSETVFTVHILTEADTLALREPVREQMPGHMVIALNSSLGKAIINAMPGQVIQYDTEGEGPVTVQVEDGEEAIAVSSLYTVQLREMAETQQVIFMWPDEEPLPVAE